MRIKYYTKIGGFVFVILFLLAVPDLGQFLFGLEDLMDQMWGCMPGPTVLIYKLVGRRLEVVDSHFNYSLCFCQY